MQTDKIPKVFISYSWNKSDFARELAEKLTNDGVLVVFDQWDLRPGQDKYVFMELSVNDSEITKVVILCDRTYADRANNREGGVGDETLIISSEVYEKAEQRKFIPVIIERDKDGAAYVPAYIKSRIYIDLSDGGIYGEEYEKLVRDIYEKPLYTRPPIGQRPSFLDVQKTNLFPLKELIRQIRDSKTESRRRKLIAQFYAAYVDILKKFFITSPTGEQAFQSFLEMKPVRDLFLNFIENIAESDTDSDSDYAETIASLFERLFNDISNIHTFDPVANHVSDDDIDIYKIHVWELFICVVAYLRYISAYRAIHTLLTYSYYLETSIYGGVKAYDNYTGFQYRGHLIEEVYKPTTDDRNYYTLLGKTIYTQRENLPIYRKELLAETDLFLYQVCNAYDLVGDRNPRLGIYWFPTLYVYTKGEALEWNRMKSRRFCRKLFPLFDVDSIEGLKEIISKCTFDGAVCYRMCYRAAPNILDYIKVEEIGIIN